MKISLFQAIGAGYLSAAEMGINDLDRTILSKIPFNIYSREPNRELYNAAAGYWVWKLRKEFPGKAFSQIWIERTDNPDTFCQFLRRDYRPNELLFSGKALVNVAENVEDILKDKYCRASSPRITPTGSLNANTPGSYLCFGIIK